jgi:hypothetical protein
LHFTIISGSKYNSFLSIVSFIFHPPVVLHYTTKQIKKQGQSPKLQNLGAKLQKLSLSGGVATLCCKRTVGDACPYKEILFIGLISTKSCGNDAFALYKKG